MLNKKVVVFTVFLMTSFSSWAEPSVWNKSYQLSLKGDYEQAALLIKPMATSDNEYALLRYAYLKNLQGEYGESIDYYKKAIKANPKSIDAKLGVTLPLLAQHRWREVKMYTLQVLTASHWNYTAHVRLMLAEEGMGKWSALAQHARDLAEAYPSDATALVYLARANAWQGNVAAASVAYKQALVRTPGHVEAVTYLTQND